MNEYPDRLLGRGAHVIYLVRIILLTSCLFCCASVSAQTATAHTPRPKATPAKPRVELAVWNDTAEKSLGITEEGFKSMGLGNLTTDEYTQLLYWAFTQQSAAETKGMDEGKKAADAMSSKYSCGPGKTDEQSLSKVSLFIVSNDDTPPEIMSGLRQRLRSISDVQIVFTKKEADLVITVLGIQPRLEGGGSRLGYTTSTTVTSPCTWTIGTQSGEFEILDDAFLNTSSLNVANLVESIVTTIDSHDIEGVRQGNAGLKKILQFPKK